MPETISVSRVIPARAERIFTAWLDADEHAKMTGSGATAGADGTFTAWDGYIKGRTIESTPSSRIVQRWRTTEFPEGADDSTLTVLLEDLGAEGTKVTVTQEGMPEGQSDSYADGWDKFYFDPMTKYFSSAGSRMKDVGAAIEEAVEKTSEAVGQAIEEATEELGETAKQAADAMKNAGAQAKKAVKAVKKAQKSAVAKAKAVGQKVGKLLGVKQKAPVPKPAAKKAAAKKAPPQKPAAKKAAPKKAAPKKVAAKKVAPKKVAPKKAAPKPKAKMAGRR